MHVIFQDSLGPGHLMQNYMNGMSSNNYVQTNFLNSFNIIKFFSVLLSNDNGLTSKVSGLSNFLRLIDWAKLRSSTKFTFVDLSDLLFFLFELNSGKSMFGWETKGIPALLICTRKKIIPSKAPCGEPPGNNYFEEEKPLCLRIMDRSWKDDIIILRNHPGTLIS